jgi:hypothetical protein
MSCQVMFGKSNQNIRHQLSSQAIGIPVIVVSVLPVVKKTPWDVTKLFCPKDHWFTYSILGIEIATPEGSEKLQSRCQPIW